jgi:hypothetical protein
MHKSWHLQILQIMEPNTANQVCALAASYSPQMHEVVEMCPVAIYCCQMMQCAKAADRLLEYFLRQEVFRKLDPDHQASS